MSNSPQADNSDNSPRAGLPTAVIHKKILDAAREDPNASPVELSQHVSGASVELVERVLENYGDPADRLVDTTAQREPDDAEANPDAERAGAQTSPDAVDADAPMNPDTAATDTQTAQEADPSDVRATDSAALTSENEQGSGNTSGHCPEESPDASDLTEVQLETLAAVAEHPQATQRELADVLDVSCATVNRRVNAVDGLSWSDRQSFVESLFETRDGVQTAKATRKPGVDGVAAPPDSGREPRTECAGPFDKPELVRKILHACLESDRITDDEELEIIGELVSGASPSGYGSS